MSIPNLSELPYAFFSRMAGPAADALEKSEKKWRIENWQGKDRERYLTQPASGQIAKEQFDGYVGDMKRLARMEALQGSVAAEAAAQRLDSVAHYRRLARPHLTRDARSQFRAARSAQL